MKQVILTFLYSFLAMSILAGCLTAFEAHARQFDSLRKVASEVANTEERTGSSGFMINTLEDHVPARPQRPVTAVEPRRERPAATPDSRGRTADRPVARSAFRQIGAASMYSDVQDTACRMRGYQPFNPNQMTAAHKTLPCGTRVKTCNPATKKCVVVLITDRGPYVSGRIIDLSTVAFKAIGPVSKGVLHNIVIETVPNSVALGPYTAPVATAAAP